MIALSETICPLCSQPFPTAQLHQHIASEHPLWRHGTIKVIQAYHPGWIEEQGACESCWKSFREADRVLNQLKGSRPQNTGGIY